MIVPAERAQSSKRRKPGGIQLTPVANVTSMSEPQLDALLQEDRTFVPSAEFTAHSLLTDRRLHDEAGADWEAFWARQATDLVTWTKPFTKTLEWESPFAKWFSDGQLNISANCLDRHVANGLGDRVAYHFEGEPGDTRTVTYAQLLDEVQRFAAGLKSIGVKRGDLSPDDRRSRCCDACVHAHRSGPLGGVRRILRRLPT